MQLSHVFLLFVQLQVLFVSARIQAILMLDQNTSSFTSLRAEVNLTRTMFSSGQMVGPADRLQLACSLSWVRRML